MPNKIILIDFDDTLETEIDGEIVPNFALIPALKKARDEGAIIIGYTNWYSLNYSLGAPGRKHIQEILQLELPIVVTTYTFLHVYQLVNQRKKPEQSHHEYINTLNDFERYELLSDLFNSTIAPLEEQTKYTFGKSELAKQVSDQLAAVETELKSLRADAKQNMGLAKQLPDDPEFNGGKEEMFRVVLAVLGKDNQYILLDDKPEASNVVEKIAEIEGINAYGFCVQRMKLLQYGKDEETFDYQAAFDNPQLAKNQLMKMATDTAIFGLTNLLSRINSVGKNTEDLIQDLNNLQWVLIELDKYCGTANLQAANLIAKKLNDFYKIYKNLLAPLEITEQDINKLKQDVNKMISMQSKYSHAALDRKEKLAKQQATPIISPTSSSAFFQIPIDIDEMQIDSMQRAFNFVLAESIGAANGSEFSSNLDTLMGFNLFELCNKEKWGDTENKMISKLNQATAALTFEANNDTNTNDYSDLATKLTTIYNFLGTLSSCTSDHQSAFKMKVESLLSAINTFEQKNSHSRNPNYS